MAVFFKYQAKKYSGEEVRGRIKADHKNTALQMLRKQRLFVTKIWQVPEPGYLSVKIKSGVQVKELALFCRQFATLSSSGVPIVQSLYLLKEQTGNKALKGALEAIAEDLQGGKSLGQALSSHHKIFSAFFINMVEAGEMSGSLDHVLDRLADYFERAYELREKFKTAITYPAFIMSMAICTIGCVFIFVLPTFAQIIIELQAPISLPTAIVIQISEWLKGNWVSLLFFPLLSGLLYKKYTQTPQGKRRLDYLTLQTPVYGKIVKQMNIVRICRTLAILLESGITLMTGLELIKNQTRNTLFKEALEQAIESLKKGIGLSVPLQESSYFPPMVSHMIRVGEETGGLDTVLRKITDFYEKEVHRTITRLSTLLEPVLICLIGGIISFIMISILMPIFSIMDAM
ncbi:type II secretion system protein [Desulforamulus reducens MI-1]|uniref:Type II secretion system protein n=1 Tax=Desulforamulus reducens (strain ATCC BAA-1160 / DSM 100696 / MI-1) TaxID=349161 RepID=A4J3A5_DESRM|nr:type II secretion system F family protein [Desulforamulus reducens]ABO49558.1 type II secretion system protein [Desulforamulus reducens MI-1]